MCDHCFLITVLEIVICHRNPPNSMAHDHNFFILSEALVVQNFMQGQAALLFGVASVEISGCHLVCDGFCTVDSLQGWPGDKEQLVLSI